jgi:hypothetical protein
MLYHPHESGFRALVVNHTKEHLSAIVGFTIDGRLFRRMREGGYDSAAVVEGGCAVR